MQQKQFTLINRGMQRDLSVSKIGESSAYENHNIRITARDEGTLLSVTNERGTKEIDLGGVGINGTLVGWNVLNNHIVLFTTDTDTHTDYIYRIDYNDGEFVIVRGKYPNSDSEDYETGLPLFIGNLNFDCQYPIESVCYSETEDIQKIYWVDGRNVLRFMNITASLEEVSSWENDNTVFDSTRAAKFDISVKISKDNSGETRQNGVVQYFISYYDKHGHESGYIWASDLIYLSPENRGGAADETNNNKVSLELSNMDTSYSNVRVYSVFRGSLNGATVAYLVADIPTSSSTTTVTDDGAHLVLQDDDKLLYLGSAPVIANTISHKDQTLFLGDLKSVGRSGYQDIEELIHSRMFKLGESNVFIDGETWESNAIEFVYSKSSGDIANIPYVENIGDYPYNNQLKLSSSQIKSFKGNEKYRFALKFKSKDGVETDAFWIGDAINPLYPVIDKSSNDIKRIVAKCTLHPDLVNYLRDNGYETVQLMIAEASYSDRSVKSQGIVSPTMFNTWERYSNRTYSVPSWITRVRNSNFSFKHFEPVKNATSSAGEIQCNYWKGNSTINPFYQYKNYLSGIPSYVEKFDGNSTFSYTMVVYGIYYEFQISPWSLLVPVLDYYYSVNIWIYNVTLFPGGNKTDVETFDFSAHINDFVYDGDSGNLVYIYEVDGVKNFKIELSNNYSQSVKRSYNHGGAREDLYTKVTEYLGSIGMTNFVPDHANFHAWCESVMNAGSGKIRYFNELLYGKPGYPMNGFTQVLDAINAVYDGQSHLVKERWYDAGETTVNSSYGNMVPAYYKKHLMFVDENVVTLNSPEIEYGAVNFDLADYKFRIVGVSRISSITSDYTLDANQSPVVGESLDNVSFSGNISNRSNLDGIISWPLWKDYALRLKTSSDSSIDIDKRDSSFYEYRKSSIIHYWIYMWNHIGPINGRVSNSDESASSEINRKTFANLRFAYDTLYLKDVYDYGSDIDIRVADDVNSIDYNLKIGNENKYYRSIVSTSLSTPGVLKYPILYSDSMESETDNVINNIGADVQNAFLYTNMPVSLEYTAGNHAVIALKSEISNNKYIQTILPCFFENEYIGYSGLRTNTNTGALIPWEKTEIVKGNYFIIDYTDLPFSSPVYDVESDLEPDSKLGSFKCRFPIQAQLQHNANWVRYKMFLDGALSHFSKDSKGCYMRISTSTYHYVVVKIDGYYSEQVNTGSGVYIDFHLNDAEILSCVQMTGLQTDHISVNLANASFDLTTNSVYFVDEGPNIINVKDETYEELSYPYLDYDVDQPRLSFIPNSPDSRKLTSLDKYVFIGEIYADTGTGKNDKRYGGIYLSNVKNNRFITAGKCYTIAETVNNNNIIYGNQGDTYFQRWDCMRTKPSSGTSINNVIDITSVMLETHINVDGRTDLQRLISRIASIDISKYGNINPVYSQNDNFIVRRDLDEDYNQDVYRSAITWTKQKHDSDVIDEWTHITLANVLGLDADKGKCTAIRRFQNQLIAFQDRGISEILYNSRTQLTTEDGVPVEIANSGKVDGIRYFTNKYGVINKWSIVDGKSGLYFIDNINKAFCVAAFAANGRFSVTDLSSKLGFSTWFKKNNSMTPWSPDDNNESIISFYDKTNSDIYLVKNGTGSDDPCLVFNETLGVFSSFFDYGSLPMMTNIDDKFISFRNNRLWAQNEGLFCNFFGEQHDFWVQYRIHPDSLGDKIWTNVDYRADFYRMLDSEGNSVIENDKDLTDLSEMEHIENETFDIFKVWNEYQTTGESMVRPAKKFRIWRYVIPRALTNDSNRFGLDRIRNPWINLLMKKRYDDDSKSNRDLMQLHDVSVIYYE